MSQMSVKEIVEADIIQEPQLLLLHQESQNTDETQKKMSQLKIKDQNKQPIAGTQNTTMAPWNALFEYQKKQQQKLQAAQSKPKSQRQTQILKKIRNKSVTKQIKSQSIVSLPHRKIKPQRLNSQSEQQIIEFQTNKIIPTNNSALSINYKSSALSKFRKNKYRKKNYVFEDKIVKIKDITAKSSDTSINIKGQIIFVWQKQAISQRWAKTQMICVQICDGTGSIILAVPVKIATNRNLFNDLQIGKYVNIQKVQIRQKYPKRVCLLFNQKSSMKIITRSQIPKQQIIEVQKLGLTLKQLQLQPIGRSCNIVCLILQKSQKQYIRSFKNNDLSLCKLTVYDPIDNIKLTIKLWQQKADIKFYTNAVVYLLRGIQVKQFKGIKQYHASKDFNLRILNYSKIQNYLGDLLIQRQKKLREIPNEIDRINVSDSLENLKKVRRQYQLKNEQAIKRKRQLQLKNVESTTKEQEIKQKSNQLTNTTSSLDKIMLTWSISIIKFISIQTKSSYPLSYSICQNCLHRVQSSSIPICPTCNNQNNPKNISNKYSIKCQFYDGNDTYFGQIYQQAGKKIFAIQDEVMKVQFFEQTNINFKQVIVKQIIGDTIKAIIAITYQNIGNDNIINGYYIVDLLPFIDEQTQQSYNQSMIQFKNQNEIQGNQNTMKNSNKSIR